MHAYSRKERAWLAVSVFLLLFGWLSQPYAAKTISSQLEILFSSSPVMAAVASQSTFAILVLLPTSSSAKCGHLTSNLQICCSFRAFKFGCPFGLLLLTVHVSWYFSITRTNAATNAILWNTDAVTTPLIFALVSRQPPSLQALLAGVLAIVGVCCSVDGDPTGNTLHGCVSVLGASLGYASGSVLVEKLRETENEEIAVIHMLIWAGVVAFFVMIMIVVAGDMFVPEELAVWYGELPPPRWLLFMACTAISFNIGWLWCAELAGASWTAMTACLSIPLAMVLDCLLFGIVPERIGFAGAVLVLLGVTIASLPDQLSKRSSPGSHPEQAVGQEVLEVELSHCSTPCTASQRVPS